MRSLLLVLSLLFFSCSHQPRGEKKVYNGYLSTDESDVIAVIVKKCLSFDHYDEMIFDSRIAKAPLPAPTLLDRLKSEGIANVDKGMVDIFEKQNSEYYCWPKMPSLPKGVIQRRFDSPSPASPIGQSLIGRLVLQVSIPAFSSDCKTALCYYEWMFYGVSGGGVFVTLEKGDKWAIKDSCLLFTGG